MAKRDPFSFYRDWIKKARLAGWTWREIAEELGVSTSQAKRLAEGKQIRLDPKALPIPSVVPEPKIEDRRALAQLLREARKAGISVRELAERTGLPASRISDLTRTRQWLRPEEVPAIQEGLRGRGWVIIPLADGRVIPVQPDRLQDWRALGKYARWMEKALRGETVPPPVAEIRAGGKRIRLLTNPEEIRRMAGEGRLPDPAEWFRGYRKRR